MAARASSPGSDISASLRRELRRRVRVDAMLTASYRLHTPGASAGGTVTRNLSLGGAEVFLPERLPTGTRLTLTLRLPRIGLVATQGRIAWQGKRFYPVTGDGRVVSTGVRFAPVASVEEGRLSAFIDRLLWQDRESSLAQVLRRLARLHR